jgi:hypothetical protein
MTIILELREALIEWRQAEREYSAAILVAALPRVIDDFRREVDQKLAVVRGIVDREPWAEIAREDQG